MTKVNVLLNDGPRAGVIVMLEEHQVLDRFEIPRSIASDQNPLLADHLTVDAGTAPHDVYVVDRSETLEMNGRTTYVASHDGSAAG